MLNGAEDAQEPKSVADAVQPQSKAADSLAGMTTEASTMISKASRHLGKNLGQSEVDKDEGDMSPKAKYSIKNQHNRSVIRCFVSHVVVRMSCSRWSVTGLLAGSGTLQSWENGHFLQAQGDYDILTTENTKLLEDSEKCCSLDNYRIR